MTVAQATLSKSTYEHCFRIFFQLFAIFLFLLSTSLFRLENKLMSLWHKFAILFLHIFTWLVLGTLRSAFCNMCASRETASRCWSAPYYHQTHCTHSFKWNNSNERRQRGNELICAHSCTTHTHTHTYDTPIASQYQRTRNYYKFLIHSYTWTKSNDENMRCNAAKPDKTGDCERIPISALLHCKSILHLWAWAFASHLQNSNGVVGAKRNSK